MDLMAQAIKDVSLITGGNTGPGVPVQFTTPDGNTTVTVKAMHTKHHLDVNEEGVAVNAKKASIAVSEPLLVAAGYTVRNPKKEVALKGHKVLATDSSGNACSYVIRIVFPDEMLGLIVCILGDFE